MKHIATFLSEAEYEQFCKKKRELKIPSDYKMTKLAVKVFIDNPNAKQVSMWLLFKEAIKEDLKALGLT